MTSVVPRLKKWMDISCLVEITQQPMYASSNWEVQKEKSIFFQDVEICNRNGGKESLKSSDDLNQET